MSTAKFLKPSVAFACGFCAVLTGYGFLREHYSLEQAVSRAEVVVVAKLKEGTVKFIPNKDFHGAWDYQFELLIAEVLKGRCLTNGLVITSDMWLAPITGGYTSNQFGVIFDSRGTNHNYPVDMVQIFDTYPGAPRTAASGDIRTNHIWLLRHMPLRKASQRAHPASAMLGVCDPEDIQPMSTRETVLKLVTSGSATNSAR